MKNSIFASRKKFTQPPPRFTEATLVKELEENGIGRRERNRSVNREDGDLEPVARLHALAEHHAVRHIESLNGRRTWPSDGARHLTVDPDLRIIVDDD